MKLAIRYFPNMPSCKWMLKRVGGEYSQHAHFNTKKECELCRRLIDAKKYPIERKYKIAMQRLLTEEEFKKLRKKQRYYNPQKGTR